MLIRTIFGAAVLLGGVYMAGGLTKAVATSDSGGTLAADGDSSVAYAGPQRTEFECRTLVKRLVDESFSGAEDTPDNGPAAILQLSKTVGKLATVRAKARAMGCDLDESNRPFATMRDSDPVGSMSWEEREKRNDQDVRFDPGKPMTRPTALRPNPSSYR